MMSASWFGNEISESSSGASQSMVQLEGEPVRYMPLVCRHTDVSVDFAVKQRALEQTLAESEYEKGLLRYASFFLYAISP